MGDGMNRRKFTKCLTAIVLLLLTGRARAAEKYTMHMPLISRRYDFGCVPSPGIPFRLDVSPLNSGHVLSCG